MVFGVVITVSDIFALLTILVLSMHVESEYRRLQSCSGETLCTESHYAKRRVVKKLMQLNRIGALGSMILLITTEPSFLISGVFTLFYAIVIFNLSQFRKGNVVGF